MARPNARSNRCLTPMRITATSATSASRTLKISRKQRLRLRVTNKPAHPISLPLNRQSWEQLRPLRQLHRQLRPLHRGGDSLCPSSSSQKYTDLRSGHPNTGFPVAIEVCLTPLPSVRSRPVDKILGREARCVEHYPYLASG
jgi:hypothetical protein